MCGARHAGGKGWASRSGYYYSLNGGEEGHDNCYLMYMVSQSNKSETQKQHWSWTADEQTVILQGITRRDSGSKHVSCAYQRTSKSRVFSSSYFKINTR